MNKGYGQYCPLALATEILCRRWTVLVISRLLDGCRTFNEIHRGVPRISPALLSQRLGELEDAGLVKRRKPPGQQGYSYELTDAGRDLDDIVTQLAIWGQRWARDMDMDDLDPAFLAWGMHLSVDTSAMPSGRTVLQFDFSGTPADLRRFWLVITDGSVDMCLKHPGFETDLLVESDLRTFVEAWRGFRDVKSEIRARRIRLSGPRQLIQLFPTMFLPSELSTYPRQRQGRERRLAAR